MRVNHGAILAMSMAALVSLSACVSTTNPVPTSSPRPTSAVTKPTSLPSAAPTTSLVISASTLDVVTDGERVQSWVYVDGRPDEVEVPELTEIFGTSPTRSNESVPCEGGPCEKATASWDGFTLSWYPGLQSPFGMFVSTTVARVGDVRIASVDGTSVGDDIRGISASHNQYVRNLASPNGIILQVGVGAVDPLMAGAPFPENAVFVALEGEAPFNSVTTISAPRQNFGL